MPSEFRREVLAFIAASGGSCTVADILGACDLDQARCGVSCVRWKLYQLLNALEAEGLIVSWMEPGIGIGTKHWRALKIPREGSRARFSLSQDHSV